METLVIYLLSLDILNDSSTEVTKGGIHDV